MNFSARGIESGALFKVNRALRTETKSFDQTHSLKFCLYVCLHFMKQDRGTEDCGWELDPALTHYLKQDVSQSIRGSGIKVLDVPEQH